MSEKKRVLLLGGLGVIGQVLLRHLANKYQLVVGDLLPSSTLNSIEYRQIDPTDYEALCSSIPEGTDVIINLLGMPRQKRVVDIPTFNQMMAVYGEGTYNILQAACVMGVEKVVLASTNHVTGLSEQEGLSLLGKEINLSTYPKPDDIYGGFKLAQESWARVVSDVSGLSVICLRIGTVVDDECEALKKNKRFRRTLLSQVDCAELFKCALETKMKFGIYYGVSNNSEKPWSIANAVDELNYRPIRNAEQILQEG